MKMDDWMVAPQIFLFNVPSLIPWGFMIQFDLHIFFSDSGWGWKKPPTRIHVDI